MDGFPITRGVQPQADTRKVLRPGLHHHIAGLDETLGGSLQIRIGGHGLFFKFVQDRIVIELPPILTQFAIRRVGLDEGTRPMP
jgi:hypothetical protein